MAKGSGVSTLDEYVLWQIRIEMTAAVGAAESAVFVAELKSDLCLPGAVAELPHLRRAS